MSLYFAPGNYFWGTYTRGAGGNMEPMSGAGGQGRAQGQLDDVLLTEAKIKEKIRRIKPASAPGQDGIGAMLLQQLSDQVAPAMYIIYRKVLDEGKVPADWKRANVTPIYKKCNKTDPGNYRPVSLTSISCKVLEMQIRDELVQHMVDSGHLEESHHGFVNGR
jgi:hypothetical protein